MFPIGVQELCLSSGIVIKCEEIEGGESTGASSFVITILTCATLLFSPTDDASLAYDLKVKVYLYDKRTSWGEVGAVDVHYNLAVIKIRSNAPVQSVALKCITDDLPTKPGPFLRHHDDQSCNVLTPGSKVIALARKRHHGVLMFQFGALSVQNCGLDCRELLMTTCKASPYYNGGPLITSDGDVIGVNFSHDGYSSFLASNIVSKCLENLMCGRDVCRPWHGMTLASLYVADVDFLERIIQKFPDVSKGAVVEKVERESPAEVAGFLPNDVIVRCNGRVVACSLKFFEEMFNATGKPIEVEVVRATGERLKLSMLVEETTIQTYNRWPVYNWRALQRVQSGGVRLTSTWSLSYFLS